MQDTSVEAEAPQYEGPIELGEVTNALAPDGVGLLTVRCVRYPGCQQLVLWLPQPGYRGYGELRVTRSDGLAVDQAAVNARLSGSVQITWNTLGWPPGDYDLVIDHADGWQHRLTLSKLDASSAEPAPSWGTVAMLPRAPASAGTADEVATGHPIVYRDGFGRVLPDEDLLLRGRAMAALERQFSRRMEYEGNVRAGTATYVDGSRRTRFAHEMGGGGCKFSLDLPTPARWEAATGTPLAERDEIVQFVAERVKRDQGGASRFEIRADAINFY